MPALRLLHLVKGPTADDCDFFTGAIGKDGYERNRAELYRMWHSTGVR